MDGTNCAREIVMRVSTHPDTSKTHYILPQTIFRVKSISTSSKFCSLQKLHLSKVYITENVIQDIIRNCPNITHFLLWNFLGLKSVCISNLDKLVYLSLTVLCNRELESVHIDAPKLQDFTTSLPNLPACGISFTSCRNLKKVMLNNCGITDDILHLHISKFPLLEVLQIINCHMLRRFRISAQRLRHLLLCGCKMAEVIEIDCPTLSSFDFSASNLPILILKNVACRMDIAYHPPSSNRLISSWFLNLREYLGFSSESKNFALKFFKINQVRFDLEELGDVQIPPLSEVDDLKITSIMMIESSGCEPLMDGLLWCCHPRTISLPSSFVYQHNCIKLLCEKLLGTKRPTCCDSTRIKCWRHEFKGAKIQILGETEEDWLQGWNHLVDPLPQLAKDQGVRFQLEWDN